MQDSLSVTHILATFRKHEYNNEYLVGIGCFQMQTKFHMYNGILGLGPEKVRSIETSPIYELLKENFAQLAKSRLLIKSVVFQFKFF